MKEKKVRQASDRALGIIFILLGIITMMYANRIVDIFHLLVGTVILLVGAGRVSLYFYTKEYLDPENRHFINGMIDIIIGVVIIAIPDKSMVFICLVWGVWSIIKAILTLNQLIQQRVQGRRIGIKVMLSIVELVLGLTLLIELTNALGHHIILLGITFVIGGIKQLNSAYKEEVQS